jgi:xylulokinase
MSSANNYILAVDLGTSGMKVALVSIYGHIAGWEFISVPTHITPDGGAEQDPHDWWDAFITASQRLLGKGIIPKESISAICCSTQGEGSVPVDRNGAALMNCILWMDMRGAPFVRRRMRGPIMIEGADAFKSLRLVRITGGLPSPTGKDPFGHMLYIKECLPHIYDKTYKFLNVLDYMNLCLTGRFVSTSDSILTSWVTDNRRVDRIHYHRGLVRFAGIDPAKLPEIVPCATGLGVIRPEVAQTLGLRAEVQVVAGSIDNTAAAVGSGAIEDYQAHLYIGTSSWIAAHVPFKKTDIVSRLASVPCAIPDRYLLTAMQSAAGGNLTYLRDKILYHNDELLAEAAVPDVFKIFDQIVERVPPGSNGVMYTPWIWGERAPVDDPRLRAGLYNLSLHNTREDIIRAFFEGVAFNTRWLIAPVEKFLGRKLQHISIVGGGASSAVWCQVFADILNIPIKQVSDPIQANARGAAWIAAAGLGEITFRDIPKLVEYQRTYEPRPQNRQMYDELYRIYTKIYERMKPILHELNHASETPG